MSVFSSSYASFTEPYKFFAYRNGALSQTSNALVVLDTTSYDTGSNFATGTGLFTAPIAGWYHFDGTINFAGSSSFSNFVSLKKNASETWRGDACTPPGTVTTAISVHATVQLAASDTIGLYFGSSSGGTTKINVGSTPFLTYLSGYLLSPT